MTRAGEKLYADWRVPPRREPRSRPLSRQRCMCGRLQPELPRRPWRKMRIEIALVVLGLLMTAFTIAALAISR